MAEAISERQERQFGQLNVRPWRRGKRAGAAMLAGTLTILPAAAISCAESKQPAAYLSETPGSEPPQATMPTAESGSRTTETSEPTTEAPKTTVTLVDPPFSTLAPKLPAPSLPFAPHEDLSPRTKDYASCLADGWQDKAGKRQQPVNENPLVIRVDGRCNTPYESETVGIYASPQQVGQAAIVATNGDALLVCGAANGQYIQDGRGPSSGSTVWLDVIKIGEGLDFTQRGFIPEVNAGYVDEGSMPDPADICK